MVQLDADAPCCDRCMNAPPVTLACSVPLGGLIGLFVSLVGYALFFAQGLESFEDVIEDLGINSADQITLVLNYGVFVVSLANIFVTGYGLREKCRTRNDCLKHVTYCGFPSIIKFLVKSAVHLVVCFSVVLSLLLMFITEALWVAFLTIDAVCNSDVVDSVVEIMELIGSDTGDIADTCNSVSTGLRGTREVLIGSAIFVVSQIIILCYWYKYSTLAMVSPFYTTGKWQRTDKGVGGEAELIEMVNAHGSKSSEKGPEAQQNNEFVPKKAPRKL